MHSPDTMRLQNERATEEAFTKWLDKKGLLNAYRLLNRAYGVISSGHFDLPDAELAIATRKQISQLCLDYREMWETSGGNRGLKNG